MIYEDYIDYTNEYRKKYGFHTVVFLQVGDFFELYAVQNEGETEGADIFRIGDLCNLQVTKKNKALPEGRSNPYMAGFPLAIVQKHVQTLTNNNYTVVIIRQVTPPPNVKREVTEIISPATNTTSTSVDGNFLMVCNWSIENNLLSVGIATMDVTTGQSYVYEAYSTKSDESFALDEATRMLSTHTPKEIVLIGNAATRHKVEQLFHDSSRCVHFCWDHNISVFEKCAYQNEVLGKAFPSSKTGAGLLTAIEACHLEMMDIARTAFVYMIQFAYEHHEKLIIALRTPTILTSRGKLTLEYNSALQLNVIGCLQGDRPLCQLLNRCGTAFGSREYKHRLTSPICDVHELQRRYDAIGQFMKGDLAARVHKLLTQIQDLERIARRMVMGSFSPIDWVGLHQSLQNTKLVAELTDNTSCNDMVVEMMASYESALDIEECAKYLVSDIRGNVFQHGVFTHLDKLSETYEACFETIQSMANAITGCDESGGDSCLCRVDSNDRDGYYLTMTKKRWDNASQRRPTLLKEYSAKPLSASSSVLKITSTVIHQCSEKIFECQRKLTSHVTECFKNFVAKWIGDHATKMQVVLQWLSDVDVACTNARNATEYGYCRPTLDQSESGSFLKCVGMRHPIIERISTDVDYVTNDIDLGGTSQYQSLLLYGINASGKSSFMKAIGLNVIMAQAGMYAACTSMHLHPYQHVFTRISGADNIYRGMSSFTVEMTELNNILHRCDEYSLVLGDELCAGTESVSGIAIVSAGIDYLYKRRATFVFATHLHELTDVPIVKSLPKIRIAHMHIEMDTRTKSILYFRLLQDGQGSRVYGLEVCEALGLPHDFMKVANEVRRHVQGMPDMFVPSNASRYNKQVLVNDCKVCGKPATETHHIRYQCTATENGMVSPGVHVHRESNLVPLCEECHLKEHHGEFRILGYMQTSNGRELQIESRQSSEPEVPKNKTLKDKLRCGHDGWKTRMKNGVWRKVTPNAAERLLKQELTLHSVDLEEYRAEYFDPWI